MSATSRRVMLEGLRSALPAALLGGVPSTLHALLVRGDPLEASAAAGSILMPREQRTLVLLAAAVPVHLALSVGWAVALARGLPRRRPIAEGAAAGLAIAALDLGLIGRRYPRIRALPTFPQLADHVAFGIVVAVSLHHQDRLRP